MADRTHREVTRDMVSTVGNSEVFSGASVPGILSVDARAWNPQLLRLWSYKAGTNLLRHGQGEVMLGKSAKLLSKATSLACSMNHQVALCSIDNRKRVAPVDGR